LFCASDIAHAQVGSTAATRFAYELVDSIAVRYEAFWNRAASYQPTITRAGEVRYFPGPSARARTTTGPTAPATFTMLISQARTTAFAEFPDVVMGDPRFCRVVATDHPTMTVVLYLPDRAKRVADYLGCEAVPAELRDFERAIERAAGIGPSVGRS
jgi:hypothetical protein